MTEMLEQLIEMSRSLGEAGRDFVILGEGNTSVRADADSFWVKASGTQLSHADGSTFVRVLWQPIMDALTGDVLTDDEVQDLLEQATVEGSRSPSIETFLHAICLGLEGVEFVGHTHPTAALGLLSSGRSRELFTGSLFPDQIVILGPAYVYVPYTDPGLPLALAVREQITRFLEIEGRVPRVILMENHGVIALGGTTQEVINITEMLVKSCRILAGTLCAGGPRFLTTDNVQRIDKRPDELKRRADLR